MGSNDILNFIVTATPRTQDIIWCYVNLDSLTSKHLACDPKIVHFWDCVFCFGFF